MEFFKVMMVAIVMAKRTACHIEWPTPVRGSNVFVLSVNETAGEVLCPLTGVGCIEMRHAGVFYFVKLFLLYAAVPHFDTTSPNVGA